MGQRFPFTVFGGGRSGAGSATTDTSGRPSASGLKPGTSASLFNVTAGGSAIESVTVDAQGKATFTTVKQPGQSYVIDGTARLDAGPGQVVAPAAPTMTLTAGNGQVSIAWTDGANGGSAITSHGLYRGTSSGNLQLVGFITTGSPYVDTGLTNGTTYIYQLSAKNGAGESVRTAESAVTANAAIASATLFVTENTASSQMLTLLSGASNFVLTDAAGTGASLSPTGTLNIPALTYNRDATVYPFSADSAWNVPIGSGAVYQAAIPGNETAAIRSPNPGNPGFVSAFPIVGDEVMPIYQAAASDPLVTLAYQGRSVTANGGSFPFTETAYADGSSATFSGSIKVRIPNNFTPATVDGWAVVFAENGQNYFEFWMPASDPQPAIIRDSSGVITTIKAHYIAYNNLTDKGYPGDPSTPAAHNGIRATGHSLLGGLVRIQEVAAGRIPHGIAMVLSDYHQKKSADGTSAGTYVWPAYHPDGSYLGVYKGVIPIGSMFAIPWNVDIDKLGLQSAEMKMLARAFQEYGGYNVDTAYNTLILASLESGMPASSVTAFKNSADIGRIRDALCLVSNNVSTAATAGGSGAPVAVGGGGTPRLPATKALVAGQGAAKLLKATATKSDGGAANLNITLPILPKDTSALVMRNVSTLTIPEKTRLGLHLFANKPIASVTLSGTDAAKFEVFDYGVPGLWLRYTSDGVNAGAQTYSVTLNVTDIYGVTTTQAVTVNQTAGNDYGQLVQNPSPATGDLTGWTASPVYLSGFLNGLDTDPSQVTAVNGKLRVATGGPNNRLSGSAIQMIRVVPGRTYTLNWTATASGTASALVEVVSKPDGSSIVYGGQGNFVAPANKPYVFLRLTCTATSNTASDYAEFTNFKMIDTVDIYAPTFVTPQTFFQNGENGVWLDGTDNTAMQADVDGGAVASGGTVGRFFDKRLWSSPSGGFAANLGPEIITDPNFANTIGTATTNGLWYDTGTNGTWTASASKANKAPGNTDQLSQNFANLLPGAAYVAGFTSSGVSGGSLLSRLQGGNESVTLATISSNTTIKKTVIKARISSTFNFAPLASGFTGAITAVTLKLIPGHPAFQDTSANRPVWTSNGTYGGYLSFTGSQALTVQFDAASANIGTNCTVLIATDTGITTLTAQTVTASYTLPLVSGATRHFEWVIVNRALIAQEVSQYTASRKAKFGLP